MPHLTIYIATYRRPAMLKQAIESVLMQDFEDYELVIHDDASGDETPDVVASYGDRRIRYLLAKENIGGTFGHTEIMRRMQATCASRLCMYMCDDDFYIKPDLFSTQVGLFDNIDGLAMCLGGVAQRYPHKTVLPGPAQPWLSTHFVGDTEDTVFVKNVYPQALMSGRQFLEAYAEDYPNRNIVQGAAMFRSNLVTPRLFNQAFAWQAGAAWSCGMATQGGVFYLDEPTIINRVDINCASFRGSQKTHYEQCLASIDAGYSKVMDDPEMKVLRDKTALSVTMAYLGNKIGNRRGYFRTNPLGDISHVLVPEITADEFFDALARHNIPLTQSHCIAIEMSDRFVAETA